MKGEKVDSKCVECLESGIEGSKKYGIVEKVK